MNLPNATYQEFYQEPHYFTHTLRTLKQWYESVREKPHARPVIPQTLPSNVAVVRVENYFNEAYQTNDRLPEQNFADAVQILEKIVSNVGVSGLYSFFRVLSHTDPTAKDVADKDDECFKRILSEVIVPHFEAAPVEERLHGMAAVGHTLAAAFLGPAHAPAAAISAGRYAQLRAERVEHRKSPSLDVINQLLPMLISMRSVAQHTIDILNTINGEDRILPPVAPIDIRFLEDTLEHTRAPNRLRE